MFPEMRAVIARAIGPFDDARTGRPGHATELAKRAAAEGRELVIAVGGDGTLHEVANGILASGRSREVRVGFIGQGTGGDFRRTLGIEHRLDRYLECIAGGKTRVIDAGRASFRARDGSTDERFFVNILSCGMGGLVDRYVADASRVMGGKAAYFAASAVALARSSQEPLACRVWDGGGEVRRNVTSYMLAICNGRFFGGGMHVAPMARPDDGRFEVVSLGAPSKLAFALASRKIYSGEHLRDAVHFSCERIDVELARGREPFYLDIDGEALGALPLSVEVLPRALTLCAS